MKTYIVVMKLNFKIVFCVFFLVAFQAYAQVDDDKKSGKIPAEETKKKDSVPTPLQIKPKDNIGLSKTKKNINGIPLNSKIKIKEHKEEFSMFDNSTLINPGVIFEKRWNQKAVEQGIKIESMSDQFLGDYRSNGKFVNIVCRDHEFPDGDLVRVFVNGDVYIPTLLLTGGYKSFDVPLIEGINEIVFQALNQGDSGPNTAEFQVYDDNGVLVSSKKWNLLTGVKAKIIVVKEKSE